MPVFGRTPEQVWSCGLCQLRPAMLALTSGCLRSLDRTLLIMHRLFPPEADRRLQAAFYSLDRTLLLMHGFFPIVPTCS